MIRISRVFQFSLAATLLASATAQAQSTDARKAPSTVRVHVSDSLGAPIGDAEVTLMRGLKEVIATARTNAGGDHEFIVDLDSTDYSIVARKVGYKRGDRFIAVERNLVIAPVVMNQILGSLPSVTVTAAADLRRKSYHIDADDIAASRTVVNDALDIVTYLRPDMITSRAGSPSGRSSSCGTMQDLWVNGRRYPANFVIPDQFVVTRARNKGRGLQRTNPGTITMLSEIRPEHVSEMNYRDCFDDNMKRIGTNNAVFITLKPGVAYRQGRGTFVVGDTASVVTNR
jgi:hypothetical protein